ncbi:MAG TPA: DoxX family protein [Candidatus Aquilonibacter sp.]|nr:DoxX family protein [Candidatus Aquilonibacter sp.]
MTEDFTMTEKRTKIALTGMQWVLGLVILIEAILFVMPSARHDFAKTHMPDMIRQLLGWGEIIGSVLLLIPRTAVRGGWLLIVLFVLAIVVHLLHGVFNVGNLVIYTAAAWMIVSAKAATHPLR